MGNTSDVVVESARQGDTPGADPDAVAGAAVDHGRRHRLGSSDGHLGAGVAVVAETAVTPIPASIVRAISAIKATVEAVKKSQKNNHGGYMFSSTDDVYAAVARKMGEVGYHLHALEEKCEIVRIEKEGKTVQWLHAVYSFLHATETDTWSHPKDRRTIYVQITGPQTFQGAQSFAEKSYIRSLLKLPSGDVDLDSMPQAETEEDQTDLLAPRKKKSSASAKRDGTADVFNELRGAISSANSVTQLQLIKSAHYGTWQAMPSRWLEILDAEYDDKVAELESVS